MLSSLGKQTSVFIWGNREVLDQKTLGYNFMISSIEKVWAKDYEIQGGEKLCKLGTLLINKAWHYKQNLNTKLSTLAFALSSNSANNLVRELKLKSLPTF